MMPSLYTATVPILTHYLDRLHQTLGLVSAHAAANGQEPSQLLAARLAENMFPFAQQASTVCGFAYRICCPLLNIAQPPMLGGDQSFEELQERIAGTLQFLGNIREEDMAASDTLAITTTAGFAKHIFTAHDYVLRYAMPNFFFHLTMVYAILRAQGVPVGKQDFDGYHEYPANFHFPESSATNAGGVRE